MSIDTDLLNAFKAGELSVAALAHLDFDGEPMYVWTGLSPLTWDGKSWMPVGSLGKVSALESTTEGRISRLSLTLGSLKQDVFDATGEMAQAFTLAYKHRSARLYLCSVDENMALIGQPWLAYAGPMAKVNVQDSNDPSVKIEVESREATFRRANRRFRTDAEHRLNNPTDSFFSFVTDVTNKIVYWGMSRAGGGGGGSGGGGRNDEDARDFKLR